METPLTAFVVDIGSLSVRCGYSGDDAPRQLHASCVGVYSPAFSSSLNDCVPSSATAPSSLSSFSSSCSPAFSLSSSPLLPDEDTGVLLFPLTFSSKRKHVAVQPCLYPTFASGACSASSSSWGKTSQPSYILHEDVFETLLSCCVEGPLSRFAGGASCCDGAGAAAAAEDDEEEDDTAAATCPVHSDSRGCGWGTSSNSSGTGSTSGAGTSPWGGGGAASAAAASHVADPVAPSPCSGRTDTTAASCRCRKRRWKKGRGASSSSPREWRATEMCGLGESLCDFPLLLSEPNLHCRELREKMVEIAFEKLSSPAVYVAPRAQLSCLSLGRSSGMIVDIGAAATSVAPVVDGFVLHQEVGEWPAGGNLLDQLLACALRRHRLPLLPLFAAHKKYAVAAAGADASHHRGTGGHHSHHHHAAGGTAAAGSAAGGGAAGRGGGGSSASTASSGSSKFLDWSGVHPTYLQRSQCAALRALKEGFFRVAPGGARMAAAAAAREESSPRAAAGGREAADAETAGGGGNAQQTHQPRSISPLVFPAPTAAAGATQKQQQQLQHPISSRYITVLPPPPPPQHRSAHHAAARDRSSSGAAAAAALAAANKTLELPDGTLLAAEELATAIPEVLFRPQEMLQQLQQEETWLQGAAVRSFRGIGLALREVAARVESLEARREVLNGIVLTGGCSAMPGLYERLNAELQNDPSLTHGLRWRLLAAPAAFERKYSSWLGGSILSSMGAFQSMWCSREEYAEHGPSIVERKCY